jgi:hypothetical protein
MDDAQEREEFKNKHKDNNFKDKKILENEILKTSYSKKNNFNVCQ